MCRPSVGVYSPDSGPADDLASIALSGGARRPSIQIRGMAHLLQNAPENVVNGTSLIFVKKRVQQIDKQFLVVKRATRTGRLCGLGHYFRRENSMSPESAAGEALPKANCHADQPSLVPGKAARSSW